jgi:hypothetical protein
MGIRSFRALTKAAAQPRSRRISLWLSMGAAAPVSVEGRSFVAQGARDQREAHATTKEVAGPCLPRETRSGSKGVSKGGFSHSLASAVTPRSIATRNLLFIFAFIVAAPLPAALPLRTNDQSVCLHVSPPNPSYANRRARCRIFSRECIGGTGTPACAGSPRRQHVFWSNWRD